MLTSILIQDTWLDQSGSVEDQASTVRLVLNEAHASWRQASSRPWINPRNVLFSFSHRLVLLLLMNLLVNLSQSIHETICHLCNILLACFGSLPLLFRSTIHSCMFEALRTRGRRLGQFSRDIETQNGSTEEALESLFSPLPQFCLLEE